VRGFFDDCRHALRLYRQTPGASTLAVLVLAVGIAFVGAFLSLYVDLVLRPHPGFEQSGRLVTIGQNTRSSFLGFNHDLVGRLSDEMASIDAAGFYRGFEAFIGTEREPVQPVMVSEEFFPGLRPRIAFGRGLEVADHAPDAAPVVVLSYWYWQQRFGGDRAVLGTEIEIARNPDSLFRYQGPPGNIFGPQIEPEQDSERFRIVGVVAENLAYLPTPSGVFEVPVWLPIERVWQLYGGVPESLPATLSNPNFVRRAPGASLTAVLTELRARYGGAESTETLQQGATIEAFDGLVGDPAVQRDTQRQLEMFLAGSVILILVAAANVSLFLLARAPARRRELGIRLAVGAPVRRLARQLAVEAGVIVVVAGTLGIIGSAWLGLYIRGLALMRDADWIDVTLLDWRVLGLTGAGLVLLTLLVSLAPVLGLRQTRISASSRLAVARASLSQRVAGTAQIAAAGAFSAAAIAFSWHIGLLIFGDAGYETSDRHAVYFTRLAVVEPSTQDMSQEARRDLAMLEAVRRREVIEAIPGVESVAFGEPVPGFDVTAGCASVDIPLPNDPANVVVACRGWIDREYIDVLGLRLIHGRAPEELENSVALVNQALARALFGREDVVGERIPDQRGAGAEIIGVIEDLSFDHPAATVKPQIFVAAGRSTRSGVVHTTLTAAGLQEALDGAIADGTIDAQVYALDSLESLRSNVIAPDLARGFLTLTTAGLVVLIAAFGFYGTQRYLVAAGRREYAIRVAVGAAPDAVGRLVILRALQISLPGIAIGGMLAFIVAAYLRGDYVVSEVSPGLVTMLVVLGLASIVFAATIGPARETRRTQPAPLLRED